MTGEELGEKSLPHSTETERAVLGAVLMDPQALGDLVGRLASEDFYVERHALLFRAMLDLHGAGVEPDLRTLQAHLEQAESFDRVGGLAYLTGLDLDLPDLERLETYVEIIRERATRRRMIEACGKAIRGLMAGDPVADAVGPLLGQADASLTAEGGPAEGFQPLAASLDAYMDWIEEPRPARGPKTGITTFDGIYGGFEPGRLVLAGGMSGVGKTAFLVQMVVQDLLAGRVAGVVSLEMKRLQLLNRIMAHGSTVDSKTLWTGRTPTHQFSKVIQFARVIGNRPELIHVDDGSVQRISQIKAKVRKLVRQQGAKVVYVDFLSLISKDVKEERRLHEQVNALAYDLARLAGELEITVVVLCQLNRGPANEKRVPRLTDLREGGEQAAWYVVILHRDLLATTAAEEADGEPESVPLYGPKGLMILAKNRDGDQGAIRTWYDGPRLQWWDRGLWDSTGGQRGVMLPPAVQQHLLQGESE